MIYLLIAAGVFLLDFFIKRHIDKTYDENLPHPRLGGRIIIKKYYNSGAAFNLLSHFPRAIRAIHTCAVAAVGIAYYLTLRTSGRPLAKTGLSLLFGGGMSNLYDRYTKGHVVDYFRLNLGPGRLRRIVFNLSDFFVFFGALLAAATADFGQNIP